MATEIVDIRINETGGAQAASNVRNVGVAAEGASASVESFKSIVSSLTTTLGTLGLALGVKEIIKTADSYNDLLERLKSVSKSSQELIAQEEALFEVAQRTRSGLESTVNLYADLKLATSDLGVTNTRLLGIVTTLNQAMIVNGKSSDDVAGSMRRFAASLSQGTIDGRGLNTIMLQFPALSKAIADAMGVSVGRLRELSTAGALSATQILNALQKAAPQIAIAFAKTQATISSAFTVFENAVMRTLGLMDAARGTTDLLANALIFLAQHMETLLPITLAVVAGLTTFGVIVAATSTVVASFFALFLANPFALFIAALVVIIELIFAFGNTWKVTADGQISVLGILIGTWNVLKESIVELAVWLQEHLGPIITTINAKLQEWIKWLNQTKEGHAVLVGAIVGVSVAIGGLVLASSPLLLLLTELVAALAAGYAAFLFFKGGTDLVKQKFGEMADTIKSTVSDISESMTNKFGKAFRDASKETAASGLAAKDWGTSWQKTTDDTVKIVNGGNDLMQGSLKKTGDTALDTGNSIVSMATKVENAMGDMVDAVSEAAARDGKAFNKMAGDATKASSSIADSFDSIKPPTISGGSGSSGSGSGTQTGFTGTGFTQSFGPIGGFGGGGVAEAIKAAGGNFDALFAAVRSADALFGTPQGPNTQAALLKVINQQNENVKAILRPVLGQFGGRYPTFATGGSFSVGGGGGVDSELVQFMATPGERVNVQTPLQASRSDSKSAASNGRPIHVSMTVVTPDAASFRRSQTQISTELLGKLSRAQQILTS